MKHFRLTRKFIAPLAALVIGLGASPTIVSSHNRDLLRHRLDTRAGVPAFKFGFKPGFNPRPSGIVTIYGDGKVETTGQTTRHAVSRLSLNQLKRLMLLADVKGFFQLPGYIRAAEPMPDSTSVFITIHTLTQDKTVAKVAGARNASFDQLLAKLNAAVAVGH